MGAALTSIEAEQAVLGACMIDGGALSVSQRAGLIEGAFSEPAHQQLWGAMCRLSDKGMGLDVLTLGESLQASGELAELGGDRFLIELVSNTPSAANVEAYARIVVERAQQRRWLQTLQRAAGFFADPTCSDPITQAETLLAGLESRHGGAAFETLRAVLEAEVKRLDARFNGDQGEPGLQTGYHNIDHRLGNLQNGELIVIGARPGMGKTAYSLNIVRQVGKQRQPGSVLVYSLEMTNASLVQRMLAAEGKIKKDLLRSAQVFGHEDSATRLVAATRRLLALDIKLCDQPGLTVREIRSMALAEKRRSGVRLVVVDYLGLIEYEGNDKSTADQVAAVTKTLKRMARELGCPVLLLCQLNRDVDNRANKRPVLRDLRDSGAIEQDADVVQFLYRDEVYTKENCNNPGQVEVITAKCREGEVGTDYLTWQGQYQLMESNSIYDQPPAADDDWA